MMSSGRPSKNSGHPVCFSHGVVSLSERRHTVSHPLASRFCRCFPVGAEALEPFRCRERLLSYVKAVAECVEQSLGDWCDISEHPSRRWVAAVPWSLTEQYEENVAGVDKLENPFKTITFISLPMSSIWFWGPIWGSIRTTGSAGSL